MITLHDLDEAIKKCEGQVDPTPTTALKLAAYYTIKNELFSQKTEQQPLIDNGYSFAAPDVEREYTIDYKSKTEFGEALNGKEAFPVWEIMDDLMSVLQTAQPRVYRRILEQIKVL